MENEETVKKVNETSNKNNEGIFQKIFSWIGFGVGIVLMFIYIPTAESGTLNAIIGAVVGGVGAFIGSIVGSFVDKFIKQ